MEHNLNKKQMPWDKLPPCPCGQPAIEMSRGVPCCATCKERENRYYGKRMNMHGEEQTALNDALAKYRHIYHFGTDSGKKRTFLPDSFSEV